MPDPTTNYGWDVPTPGGDNGAWGTILNGAFDDIDAELYALAGKLSEAAPLHLTLGSSETGWAQNGNSAHATGGASPFYVPILDAKAGKRITAFSSRAVRAASVTATVSLVSVDSEGNETEVSAGHSITTLLETVSTSGLTHDVVANKAYFLKIDKTGSDSLDVFGLTVTMIATPA